MSKRTTKPKKKKRTEEKNSIKKNPLNKLRKNEPRAKKAREFIFSFSPQALLEFHKNLHKNEVEFLRLQ